MTAFKWFSVTNLPREISRQIENCFQVEVSRVKKDFVSRYGHPGFYFEYRLNHTEHNLDGIEKMKAYVSKIENQPFKPPVKRDPKIIHVKNHQPVNNLSLDFNEGSWDEGIE